MRRNTLRTYLYVTYFTFLASLFVIYKNVTNFNKNTSLLIQIHPANELKYILQWTSPKNSPFVYMGIGRKGFIYNNCTYTNCYVTSNRNFFYDLRKFDAIIFAGPEVITYNKEQLPKSRSPHQKYVFANIESAAYYPICRKLFNGYFNWTWTYKLDSDVRWGYIVVKNTKGKVVGPKKEMHWIKYKDMLPVSNKFKNMLRRKTKAAAWFVSNCRSASDRETYVVKLNRILQKRYNLSIDIYGECGQMTCSRENETKCFEKIKNNYYFYLSFENAFSEDYVTEKLLNAVQNNAIPIVYGGANYSRFLPEGSYLDARKFDPEKMAKKMYQLINNFNNYVEYFRWTNHYSYHRTSASIKTNEYCNMCALLNDKRKVKSITVYKDLLTWWDPPDSLCYDNLVQINVDMVNLPKELNNFPQETWVEI